MKKLLPYLFILLVVGVFFWQFLLKGLLPIPSDTIIGLYQPFRDLYAKDYPNGIPFKNFLITDPVRQQYPWKNLAVTEEKQVRLPLWNPYNFAGTPLLANFQSGVFYPLNLLFLALPFSLAWSLIVFLQPLLAGLFLYCYLSNLKLNKLSSLLGAVTFSFCGFSIAWMEWGTIVSTALWLPLILLAIDKIFETSKSKLIWYIILAFSLVSSFFAGHLQTFFYLAAVTFLYLFVRWLQTGEKIKFLAQFAALFILCLIIVSPQLLPALKFISLSARNVDLVGYTQAGWFIPWQNLIQFIAPDFFGNPATLNYYGIWNYGEFIGYVGIVPLIMAFYALFYKKDKNVLFFGCAFFLSLFFALPDIVAKIPFKLNIPFLSTAQPTRLLFVTDFSLSILAAFGLDLFINSKNKKSILTILSFFALIFAGLWSFVIFFHKQILTTENLLVAKQNLILPTGIFIIAAVIIIVLIFNSGKKLSKLLVGLLLLITVFDLFRFGWKFEPFTKKEYLYPSTTITTFLQNQKGQFRIMATDPGILPPNFSVMYSIQTLDGYDPLYLQRYGELMVASGRSMPDISTPFGFNRIITPEDALSRTTDLLGVKYVLTLTEMKNSKLKQVFTDGNLRVYENTMVFPRAFFVNTTFIANSKQEAINAIFDLNFPLNKRAVVENVSNSKLFKSNWDLGQADIQSYTSDKITISINNPGEGFLVLTDSYYPTWQAKIDGKQTQIYLTDFNFRGIITPKGKHTIEFYDTLF